LEIAKKILIVKVNISLHTEDKTAAIKGFSFYVKIYFKCGNKKFKTYQIFSAVDLICVPNAAPAS
jgi:hypothetical protein